MILLSVTDKLRSDDMDRLNHVVNGRKIWVESQLQQMRHTVPLQDVEIWITYGSDITDEILEQMPSLKWIQIFQSGIEKVPLKTLKNRSIMLTNIKGIHSISMPEHVLSTILYFSKNIQKYVVNKQEKTWDRKGFDEEIFGKTVSIFGAGTVGEAIAEKCRFFGLHVIGINTSGVCREPFHEMYTLEMKHEVLEKSDFVVLLLPALPATFHCISKKELSVMKDSAYLINVGRGSHINNEDLISALEKATIRGAALDVFEEEPLPANSPLWEAPNLLITPHMAARTERYFGRAINKFSENFQAYANKEKPPYYIDLDKGY